MVSGLERVPPYEAIVSRRYEEAPQEWAKVTHETVDPIGIYGAAKIWGESLGRHFSDEHGLSSLCVRIGRVTAENRPIEGREFSVYLSQRDIAQMLQKCIDAPDDLKYGIFFATSNNKWGYRDIEHPRQSSWVRTAGFSRRLLVVEPDSRERGRRDSLVGVAPAYAGMTAPPWATRESPLLVAQTVKR